MPRAGGGIVLARNGLIATTGLFTFVGMALLALSIYFGNANQESHHFLEKKAPETRGVLIFAPVVTMVFGFAVLGLGIFGFFGAWGKPNKVLMIIFFGILTIVFITELALGFTAFGFRGTLKHELDRELGKVWNDSTPPIYNDRMQFQFLFGCCGFKNTSDRPGPDCRPENNRPCFSAIEHRVLGLVEASGIAMIVTASLELFGLVFAMAIICLHGKGAPEDGNDISHQEEHEYLAPNTSGMVGGGGGGGGGRRGGGGHHGGY
eukprot:JP446705.1.p1 GENE.JP446705.1~~JP446705.1.p1  ORF type:complete len:263 (+),score=50.27 JP446705.1:66-854(+)